MKPPVAHLDRDHLGRNRVDAGRDRDTLCRHVVPERLDLMIRVRELARHRPLTSRRPRRPGLPPGEPPLGGLLFGGPLPGELLPGELPGGPLFSFLLLPPPPRFRSGHRLFLFSAPSNPSVTRTPTPPESTPT